MVSKRVILRVEQLNKCFNGFEALKNISFDVTAGQVIAIIGPSGSGKTTLLRCISGLENFSGGRIEYFVGETDPIVLQENNPNTRSNAFSKIGFVFQDLQLWPHMTILENIIEAPIRTQKLARDKAMVEAAEICERLDIRDQFHKYPPELSIGQQQRAAIARTLAMSPRLILFDEITSALDPLSARDISYIVRDLTKSGITVLIVSHQVAFIRQLVDHVLFLEEGKLSYDGSSSGFENLEKLPLSIKNFVRAGLYMED